MRSMILQEFLYQTIKYVHWLFAKMNVDLLIKLCVQLLQAAEYSVRPGSRCSKEQSNYI